MPNEFFIHVIYLLILPTETICSMYGIINIRKYMNMYHLSDLPNKITYCNWRIGMVFNGTEMYNYLTTIILSILFPIAR